MILQERKKKQKNIKSTFNKFFKYYFFITISFLLIFAVLIFHSGYWNFYKKPFLDKLYKHSYINYLKIPYIIPQAIYGFFIKTKEININIAFDNQLILEKDRKNVIEIGNGWTYNFVKVNASMNIDNEDYKIDLRLKGDRLIHFSEREKASYKVEVDNNKTILGLNKFSLMKPRARNYIHEWLYHQLMGEVGLINLKYEFIKLKINGESQGLYVVEESFDKVLIERNQKRNGPIFSINEEWNVVINDDEGKGIHFEVYNKRNWLSEENLQLTLKANSLLKNFFSGKLDIEDVFDLDKWALFMAVSDLNYYSHGLKIKSVKFYYNPLSGKFEPVPFDGHRTVVDYSENIINWKKNKDFGSSSPSFSLAIECKKEINNCANLLLYQFFFKRDGKLNENFFNKYKENIHKITSKKFLDNFFKKRKKLISNINAKIYGDYFYTDNNSFFGPGIYYFNKNELYERGNRLRLRLSTIPSNIFVSQTENLINIENWNSINNNFFTNRNLVINKIVCNDPKNENKKIIYKVNQPIDNENQSIILENNTANKINCEKVFLTDKIYKTKFVKKIDLLNSIYKEKINKNIGNFLDYFNIDGKILRLKEKKLIIDKNIKIPKGYVLKINPEEEIILINSSFIISESSFNVDGGNPSIYKPIQIRGKKDNRGGGIFIINTPEENYFNNVIFENLYGTPNNILFSKYIIYGSINIYKSKIKLQNFKIKNIFSEDSINLISSNFLLKNGTFENISSDAIDVDHGNGVINNLEIKNVLNDGIDFSESSSKVSNIYFENIGDKSISNGENSEINISNLNIKKSYLGIASKDGSVVNVENISLSNVTIPFASYKKKNEYDIPILTVNKATYDGYEELYLKDKFSKIIIDNKIKKKIENNVLKIIYNPNFKINPESIIKNEK